LYSQGSVLGMVVLAYHISSVNCHHLYHCKYGRDQIAMVHAANRTCLTPIYWYIVSNWWYDPVLLTASRSSHIVLKGDQASGERNKVMNNVNRMLTVAKPTMFVNVLITTSNTW